MKSATYWVEKLNLLRHPEGGYFREIYRSSESISQTALPDRFEGDRVCSTSIYFMLTGMDFSAFHRIQSDELWHFYTGASLVLYLIHPNGLSSQIFLGDDFDNGEVFQAVIPAGTWFAAKVSNINLFTLMGCTVAPGFDFADFELAKRQELIKTFPQHEKLITQFTRV